ncbi:argininosuccinate lyase [Fusibacter paucivorans]|uniref:Argininosuccinate lyase n=1 Tax=Fusibacter paucivorans TaxID=76009 RepID=A0ABS5PKP3_9FIRM|nr:argininosuccinate lyase [Fusibacter paucivorans]MBS7525596.1 argininosuccinate lyase [Fusibacter paucivorans]
MEKLWNGRFAKDTSKETDLFNASIGFEQRLYPYDILGSYYHVQMLANQNIIDDSDAAAIQDGLKKVYHLIKSDSYTFKLSLEDIHMNIEAYLIDTLGETGKRLHTGRSRNDQVALDMRLYAKDVVIDQIKKLTALIETLNAIAKVHTKTIMPGFTHLQQAQPITLAHHLLAYVEKFKRDTSRLFDIYARLDEMPLGSGALASTSYPINRDFVKDALVFDRLTANSIDAVSDRDYLVEIMAAYALMAVHMSSLAEEIIIWNSQLFNFIELDDAYSTGSSIMPQKKNPDIAELVRGKSGRIIGHLSGMLVTLKGLPLAYNKDLQEDKESFFDTTDQIGNMLSMLERLLATASFNVETMYQATLKGFTEATDLADYLVKKGLPFRDCHHIIGAIVKEASDRGTTLSEMTLDAYKTHSSLFEADLYDVIDLLAIVSSRRHTGGPAPEVTAAQVGTNETWLSAQKTAAASLSSPLALLEAALK